MDRAMTRPPTTAVSLVDFLLQSATISGATKWDRARLVEPIQTEKEKSGF